MTYQFNICRADELLSLVDVKSDQNSLDYVISLEHPGAEILSYSEGRAPRLAVLDPRWRERQLILSCYDLERANGAFPAPGREIVEAALDYDNKWSRRDGEPTRTLVHCRSGKARSTALALVLLYRRLGKGSEQAALDEVLRVRPIAAPNIAIVQHGDDLLHCGGRLVQVVEQNDAVTERRMESERRRLRQIESGHIGKYAL